MIVRATGRPDGPNMVPFKYMEILLTTLMAFDRRAKSIQIRPIAP